MKTLKSHYLILISSFAIFSCQSVKTALYDQYSYQQITSIKVEASSIMDKATTPFSNNKEIVEKLLPDVWLLKLNEDELIIVSNWFSDVKTEKERINMLQNKFNISNIVVTKGSEGAVLNYAGKFYNHNAYKINVADTVGAGDCFLAALISKLSLMESPENALRYACAAGALIAGYSGACPDYRISEIDELIANDNN